MPSNHLILCCPVLLLPSVFLSIRVFSSESALHIRWPKYWSFSFSISPLNNQGCFPLGLTSLISLLFKGLSRVFSSTTFRKRQFFAAQPSLWPNSHIHTFVVQSLSCVQLLQPHELQHTRLSCPSAPPRICSNSCPLSWWYHPTISSSVTPSPPAVRWVGSLYQVAKILEFQHQHQSFQWIFRVDFL